MNADYQAVDRAALLSGCECLRDEPMSRHTTFRIGGPADRLYTAFDEGQLRALLKALTEAGLPWMVLGNGSNLLVSDKGIRGAVIRLDGAFREITLQPDGCTVTAGAGASLAAACVFARDRSLTGLEFAWGIPGSVGGAAYMDAGAYGGEMRDVMALVRHVTPSGEAGSVLGTDPRFAYRRSPYTGGRDVITSVSFALSPGDPGEIAAKMEELMGRRREKQPYELPSAGSVFKRPQNGYAAALIEECGLKGRAVGDAQVSEKHAGFIINAGNASCRDVVELIGIIQKTVYEKTGTHLECEVKQIGES